MPATGSSHPISLSQRTRHRKTPVAVKYNSESGMDTWRIYQARSYHGVPDGERKEVLLEATKQQLVNNLARKEVLEA